MLLFHCFLWQTRYEEILSGQVTASELDSNPNALKSVIAFVTSNFVAEGTSKDVETLPPPGRKQPVRQRTEKKVRETVPSETLQLKDDEGPLFTPENPKDLFQDFVKIGEGGVGTVYLAKSKTGNKVALKSLDVSLEQNLA